MPSTRSQTFAQVLLETLVISCLFTAWINAQPISQPESAPFPPLSESVNLPSLISTHYPTTPQLNSPVRNTLWDLVLALHYLIEQFGWSSRPIVSGLIQPENIISRHSGSREIFINPIGPVIWGADERNVITSIQRK